VVWNFLNVLTIFPAAILVNDCMGQEDSTASGTASERLQRQRFMKNASIISRQFSKEQRSTLEIGAETSEDVISYEKLECCERA
ncbi:pks3, partial [Symbiodinium sp. KB8]